MERGALSGTARRAVKRGAVVAITLGTLVTLSILVWRWHTAPASAAGLSRLTVRDATAPAGVRIRVEVINATKTRGLARRATLHLRDRGFDVVSFSTGSETRATTVVLDRSGHPEWARLVATALGGASVESRPDSSRYLDVTVLLGASWRAPSDPFYP